MRMSAKRARNTKLRSHTHDRTHSLKYRRKHTLIVAGKHVGCDARAVNDSASICMHGICTIIVDGNCRRPVLTAIVVGQF